MRNMGLSNYWIQLVIIIVGLPLGAFLSNRSYILHEQLEHNIPVVHTAMDHGTLDISDDESIPQIDSLLISKDAMSGWNVTIITSQFTFTPEHVNQTHQAGQGHAHIYINDEKFARVYGPSFHIPELAGSNHRLKVTLNANGHEVMEYDGRPIEVEAELE